MSNSNLSLSADDKGYSGNGISSAAATTSSASKQGPIGMQVSSDEINFLIYRYLQEAGFVHSAFTFAYESMITRSSISKSNVPPGALISILQKGLQYIGIEETIRQDGADSLQRIKDGKIVKSGKNAIDDEINYVDFSLLSPHAIRALTRRDPPIRLNIPPPNAIASNNHVKEVQETNKSIPPVRDTPKSEPVKNDVIKNVSLKEKQRSVPSQQPSTSVTGKGHTKISGTSPALTNKSVSESQATLPMNNARLQGGKVTGKNSANETAKISSSHGNSGTSSKGAVISSGESMHSIPSSSALQITNQRSISVPSSMQQQPSSASSSLPIPLPVPSSSSDVTPMDVDTHDKGVDGGSDYHTAMDLVNTDRSVKTSPQESNDTSTIPSQPQDHLREIESEDLLTRAKPDEVLVLNKHTCEVFMCAWNPVYTDLIASGSGDASARIWQMAGPNARSGCGQCRLLQHGDLTSADKKNKDVTTLEWSPNGELLATGSYDGVARVWKRDGTLVHTLSGHRGPIFSLKWNKSGTLLLSGSYDKTTIVWDVLGESGFIKQQFQYHTAPALDVDWKDDVTFASCSTDKTVQVCRLGVQAPLYTYRGHTDEVNAVKWDPTGRMLASCSDDFTAKIWDFSSGRTEPLHDLKSHQQEIYTVKWSPIARRNSNADDKPLLLVTASFDGSIRLWDAQNGSCISVLSRHRESVYSVAFSPSGEYLASGSLAGQLYIWSVRDGKPVKSFKGKGDIFEVAWNAEETRVAACFSSNTVNLIDFSKA